MEKIELKSAAKEVRETYRTQVHRLKKKGNSYPDISVILGIPLGTVKRYGGGATTTEKKRGRLPFVQQKLNPDQQKQIIKLITDKTPDQYKLPFALWTRKSVVLLVEERFSITVSDQTMGDYLRLWGSVLKRLC